MNLTQIGAAIGSLTGIASLTWNIYVKFSAGPRLHVRAFANMVMRPAPQSDPHFLKISIQNTGTAQTTLTNYGLFQYPAGTHIKKPLPEYSAIFHTYQGAQTPYKLGVGEEAVVLMQQDLEFDRMLTNGRPLYFVLWHAFAKKPIEVPIIATKIAEKKLPAQAGS